MLQSISKNKLYLYIFFLIFLSSIFNFKILENYRDKLRLKKININGLPNNEKKIIQSELNDLKNTNIFKLSEENVLNKLNKFKFLERIYVNKIIPSTININLSKTSILGKVQKDGKLYYIGKNGKFISSKQIFEKNKNPTVFGEFEIDEFINLHKILNSQEIEIDSVQKYYFYKNKRWDLSFSNGLLLMLPSKNVEDSLKIYKALIKNDSLKNVKIIDLRVTNQIILTNRDE